MYALIALLLAVIGNAEVHEQTTDGLWLGGREYSAVVTCDGGIPAVWWSRPRLTSEVVAHELAHIYDCLDDGALNGSPGHVRVLLPGVSYRAHCLEDPAEWYACEVVRTRRLR